MKIKIRTYMSVDVEDPILCTEADIENKIRRVHEGKCYGASFFHKLDRIVDRNPIVITDNLCHGSGKTHVQIEYVAITYKQNSLVVVKRLPDNDTKVAQNIISHNDHMVVVMKPDKVVGHFYVITSDADLPVVIKEIVYQRGDRIHALGYPFIPQRFMSKIYVYDPSVDRSGVLDEEMEKLRRTIAKVQEVSNTENWRFFTGLFQPTWTPMVGYKEMKLIDLVRSPPSSKVMLTRKGIKDVTSPVVLFSEKIDPGLSEDRTAIEIVLDIIIDYNDLLGSFIDMCKSYTQDMIDRNRMLWKLYRELRSFTED